MRTTAQHFITARTSLKGPDAEVVPRTPGAANPDRKPIARDEVERAAKALTNYVGPIAAILARKESLAAVSATDLLRRLAAKLPCERDRDDFLREVEAH